MKTALRSAIPHGDLYEKLQSIGWSLKKIDMKNGLYVASGVGPGEQEIDRVGQSPEMALAALLNYAVRSNGVRRMAALDKFAAWGTSWVDQKQEIALAYSKLPPFDEKALPAWRALAAESKVQADAIRQQIRVEVSDEPEPYPSADAMREDVHGNKHFTVSRANVEHPIWTTEDHINFRIVHEVLGHCQSGGDFTWLGENLACGVHFPLVSPLAREALFTECIGNAAYSATYKGYGPHKIGLMSEFLHPAQEKEGEHVFVPHAGIPALQQAPNENATSGPVEPAPTPAAIPPSSPAMVGIHGDGSSTVMRPLTLVSKLVSDNLPHDPNQYWDTKVKAPGTPAASPHDYLDIIKTTDNAAKIDTEWWERDEPTQRRAIMNAFRVAILSPRKHLKWNAAHYQALQHVDPATSAMEMWHLLEASREKHNQGLGHPEGSHLSYRQNLAFMADQIALTENMSEPDAMAKAKQIVFEKIKEFEGVIGRQPDMGETSELRRYNIARKMTEEWMQQNYSPGAGWMPGQMALTGSADAPDETGGEPSDSTWTRATTANGYESDAWGNDPTLFDLPAQEQVPDSTGFASEDSKYGAFMGTHLDALEQVGKHIDAIHSAALEDIDKDGGKGHVFRNKVMNMNLAGVNPKVCSFAWLLLRPMSSDLGIIDTHILRGLRRGENDMSVKDYYKLERMQKALKDASGYSHVPLGLYHWGMWDHVRNPGQHSDHSPLRVLDPKPWDDPDMVWDSAASMRDGIFTGHPAFEAGRPRAEETGAEFDKNFAGQRREMVPHVNSGNGVDPERRVSPFVIPFPRHHEGAVKPQDGS